MKNPVVEFKRDLLDLQQAKSMRSIRAGVKKILADLEHQEVKDLVGDTKLYEDALTGFLDDQVGFEETEETLVALAETTDPKETEVEQNDPALKTFIGMLNSAEVESAMEFYDQNKGEILSEKPGIEPIISTILDADSARVAARAITKMKALKPKKASIEYGSDDPEGDGDIYVKITDPEDFDTWCIEGGWDDAAGFEEATGVSFEELAGVWFTTFNNRVLLADEFGEIYVIDGDMLS